MQYAATCWCARMLNGWLWKGTTRKGWLCDVVRRGPVMQSERSVVFSTVFNGYAQCSDWQCLEPNCILAWGIGLAALFVRFATVSPYLCPMSMYLATKFSRIINASIFDHVLHCFPYTISRASFRSWDSLGAHAFQDNLSFGINV